GGQGDCSDEFDYQLIRRPDHVIPDSHLVVFSGGIGGHGLGFKMVAPRGRKTSRQKHPHRDTVTVLGPHGTFPEKGKESLRRLSVLSAFSAGSIKPLSSKFLEKT